MALEDEKVLDHKLLFLGPPDSESWRRQLLGPPIPHVDLLHIGEWSGIWVEQVKHALIVDLQKRAEDVDMLPLAFLDPLHLLKKIDN